MVDDDGNAHFVWQLVNREDEGFYYAHTRSDGSWSSPALLGGGYELTVDDLVVGTDGRVHLLWRYSGDDILYSYRKADGTWSERDHVVWPGRTIDTCSGLSYATIDAEGKWTVPSLVSMENSCPGRIWLRSGVESALAVTVDQFNPDTLCRVSLAPGAPGSARCVDTPFPEGANLDVAIDGDGIIRVLWSQYDSGLDYVQSARAEDSGTAVLSQAVAVPDDNHPTLSFLYQLDGARLDGGYLAVSVTDALSETTVYSTSDSAGSWTHGWADLSSWRGEGVTLTFKVQEVAGAPRTGLFLDEVTLAPAYPDSWVDLKAPFSAPAGDEVILLLAYGNRGGVTLADASLALSLPPQLTFAEASPAPTTELQWDLGTLPAGNSGQIVATATVTVDATLGDLLPISAAIGGETELEMLNNVDEAGVLVGHLVFLPAIAAEDG